MHMKVTLFVTSYLFIKITRHNVAKIIIDDIYNLCN